MANDTSSTTATTADGPEWADIEAAGSIRNWVDAELDRRGLLDDGADTSRMSDKQRKAYKTKREEERVLRRKLMAQGWACYRQNKLVHVGVGVWYHDTADIDRWDIADLDGRRQLNELPELKDVHALAKVLELAMPRLRWLVYHREVDSGTHYHRWTVPKRSGKGVRLISAPKPELKRCQTWIARNISEHLPVHGAAHGFLAGRSTLTNAAAHAGAEVVVKFDVRDFYPTVTFRRVKGLFRKAGYGEQVAIVLALLCTECPRETIEIGGRTYHVATGPRSLPQGAPTSPSITNALCMRLDARLTGLARKLGFRYTRYADDLTFSYHRGEGGEGEQETGKIPVARLRKAVTEIVASEGFRVHEGKTRVMRSGGRQKVTGLVVNGAGEGVPTARVPRKLVRELRAAIRNRELGKPGKGESLEQLRGWAAYVHMCDPSKGRAFIARLEKLAE
ncbi:RNA-directed DNA polymerase [Pseudenhygromyxa sp. WMMC2535]|uniref:reverse transcriptase family protein n=1 Tax=Pseudenhygromyxa sp. WMMC2535 TaxID=2712867 RepID=UPI001551CBBE|nr:reverse transcriptase family protein [Pseudenhygromyxa sp. WMMC2535]NVB41373.1 RNA-directed DNA polymerase [Pseudenhygromyxa sp. WMMC2535]